MSAVVDVRVRPVLVSLFVFFVAIWAILVIIGGIGILIFGWWTSFGSNFTIFGLTGLAAGAAAILYGIILFCLMGGLWRMRFWAWLITFIVVIIWFFDAVAAAVSGNIEWFSLIITALLVVYMFVIRKHFRSMA
jgi:hypothetical protein